MPDVPSSVVPPVQQPIAPPAVAAVMDSEAKSVIDLLYAQQQLTKEQYEDVKIKSASGGKSATQLLQEMNIIGDDKIAQAQAQLLGIPYMSLANVSFSPQALGFLS